MLAVKDITSRLPVTPMTISPEQAMAWLESNSHNRSLSPKLVDQYAEAMKAGRWQENGETIKIDRDGRMIDGQHRLTACVKAGVSFRSMVVFDLDPDVFDTIDSGRKRTAGDILHIEGCRNSNHVASAFRWQEAIRRRLPALQQISMTADEVRVRYVSDSSIEESVARVRRQVVRLMPGGAAGALHFEFSRRDRSEADRFFNDLASGAGLDDDDPVFVLREGLIEARLSTNKRIIVTDGEKVARCIRAWNARRAGRRQRMIKGLIASANGKYFLPEIE